MARIGMALKRNNLDSQLSDHFGKAKWLLAWEDDQHHEFIRNEGLNGRWVAEALAQAGCQVVALNDAGPGAILHLKASGMRLVEAPAELTAREVARRAARGELPEWSESAHARHEGHQHLHHDHGER